MLSCSHNIHIVNQHKPVEITVYQIVIEIGDKYVYRGLEINHFYFLITEIQLNEINRCMCLMWAAYSKLESAFEMNLPTE